MNVINSVLEHRDIKQDNILIVYNVLKNTDFPVSAYLQYSFFLGYSDEYLTRTFHLEMKENQLADIKRDAFLFSINVLEHSFEKEMERYDDWLYKEEMSGYW